MPRFSTAATALTLMLGACQAGSGPAQPAASPSPGATATTQPAETAGDECGASKVSARWLNALPTDEAKADIAAKVGNRPIRYYTQGDPITADFNPARLNVESGADGRIKQFRCG